MKKSTLLNLRLVSVLLLIMLVCAGQSSAATFYLIRHAEKQLGDDPQLTQQGEQRAQRIAHLLSVSDVEVVYSTNYIRTKATAKPIADIKNLPIVSYDAGDLEGFAQRLLKENRNSVIVGHSNTTPDLVRLMSQQTVPNMDEATYHLIYQVVVFSGSEGEQSVVNVFSSE